VRLADPDAGPPSLMPRVRIGSALPDREALDVEIEQLRDLDVEQLRNRWHTVFDRRPPPQLSAICCSAPSRTGCRPIDGVTWIARGAACSIAQARPSRPEGAP
jgi:hypothetical protein